MRKLAKTLLITVIITAVVLISVPCIIFVVSACTEQTEITFRDADGVIAVDGIMYSYKLDDYSYLAIVNDNSLKDDIITDVYLKFVEDANVSLNKATASSKQIFHLSGKELKIYCSEDTVAIERFQAGKTKWYLWDISEYSQKEYYELNVLEEELGMHLTDMKQLEWID